MWSDTLLHRKLVFVTGKGGVGKTSCSVALAQSLKDAGKKVLLVESSKLPQLPEYCRGLGIDTLNLEISDCFRDYIVDNLGQARLYEAVFSRDVVKTFLETIPGLGEVMLLGRIFWALNPRSGNQYDMIIFDAPSSGHFLSLLTTPKAMIDTGIGGPLIGEVQKVYDFLKSGAASMVYLVTPEELVVSEAIDFLPQIQSKVEVPMEFILLNRFPPHVDSSQLKPVLRAWVDQELSRSRSAAKMLFAGVPEALRSKLYTLDLQNSFEFPMTAEICRKLLSTLKIAGQL
ncbi:MAG: ArsA-related P-loop ATPase [Pseudomonadota bacterium]